MFCNYCGSTNPSEALFCSACGKGIGPPLSSKQEEVTSAQSPPTPERSSPTQSSEESSAPDVQVPHRPEEGPDILGSWGKVFKLYRQGRYRAPLNEIGGWLGIVAIGIVISPFLIAYRLLANYLPVFSDGTWELLSTKGTEYYRPAFAPLITFEIIGNIGFLVGWIYIAYKLFTKSKVFPKAFIALIVAELVFILLSITVTISLFPGFDLANEKGVINEIARSGIRVLILVPYMLKSKRVKATFLSGN